MAKITKGELLGALETAAVVLIGSMLVLAIPILGPLLSKLPSWTIWGLTNIIALPSIIAAVIAVLAYKLIRAKFK